MSKEPLIGGMQQPLGRYFRTTLLLIRQQVSKAVFFFLKDTTVNVTKAK